MIDLEINKTLKELNKHLNPKVVEKINSHLYSLTRQIDSLRESRDNWRKKYEELKNTS
jgi:uncharacterized coiled-coil DUF342 family protein